MKFEGRFQPIRIGNLTIKNRIVAAPLNMDYGTRGKRGNQYNAAAAWLTSGLIAKARKRYLP